MPRPPPHEPGSGCGCRFAHKITKGHPTSYLVRCARYKADEWTFRAIYAKYKTDRSWRKALTWMCEQLRGKHPTEFDSCPWDKTLYLWRWRQMDCPFCEFRWTGVWGY